MTSQCETTAKNIKKRKIQEYSIAIICPLEIKELNKWYFNISQGPAGLSRSNDAFRFFTAVTEK